MWMWGWEMEGYEVNLMFIVRQTTMLLGTLPYIITLFCLVIGCFERDF